MRKMRTKADEGLSNAGQGAFESKMTVVMASTARYKAIHSNEHASPVTVWAVVN